MTDKQIEVAKKIIEQHKKKGRFIFNDEDSLEEFLLKNFKIKTIIKKDAEEKAYELLNINTLECFSENLKDFGISKNDMVECLGISDYMGTKFLKEGKVRVKGTFATDYKNHEYKILNVMDIISVADSIKPKEIKLVECTIKNLAEALYLINKSAKISRDTKQMAYDHNRHKVCKASKTRSWNLYHLKDAAIKKMIEEGKIEYVGIQKQIINGHHATYLDLYQIADFTFHCPHSGEVEETEIMQDVIDGEIGAEKTRKVSINFQQAVKLLEKYSGASATGNKDLYWETYLMQHKEEYF